MKKLLEEGTIAMYCDFHAHSRKVISIIILIVISTIILIVIFMLK